MLLSFRDRLIIVVSSGSMSVSIVKKGWRQKIQLLGSQPFVMDDVPHWTGLINTLRQWMSATKWKSTDIQLIISDRFTRYVLLPWPGGLRKRNEMTTLARIHFNKLFGSSNSHTSIVYDVRNYGQMGIACAVESEFLNELKAIFGKNRNRLLSIEPRFVNTFNICRNRLASSGLFVSVEKDYCVMSLIKNNVWKSIRTVKLTGKIEESLLTAIKREIILQDADDKIHIYFDSDIALDRFIFSEIQTINFLRTGLNDLETRQSDAVIKVI